MTTHPNESSKEKLKSSFYFLDILNSCDLLLKSALVNRIVVSINAKCSRVFL